MVLIMQNHEIILGDLELDSNDTSGEFYVLLKIFKKGIILSRISNIFFDH